jgi:hypothetical protein
VSDGEVLYEAQLRQRTVLAASVVCAIAFMVAGLVGIIEGSPYVIAIILGVVVLCVLAVVVYVLLPTRIEVRAGEVRLIAPRATTKYAADAMTLRRLANGGWEFSRREPARKLAFFRDQDADRVRQVFGEAGVSVVGA